MSSYSNKAVHVGSLMTSLHLRRLEVLLCQNQSDSASAPENCLHFSPARPEDLRCLGFSLRNTTKLMIRLDRQRATDFNPHTGCTGRSGLALDSYITAVSIQLMGLSHIIAVQAAREAEVQQ